MAVNPMQRKSRNSFLLGMLLAIVVMGIVVAILLMQVMNYKKTEETRTANLKKVYVVSSDIKSGETISSSNLKLTEVESSVAPSNAITNLTNITDLTVAKIDLKKGTIATDVMIQESDNIETADVRKQEYNMIKIASQIETGDFIDIRLRMPSGTDYIVVAKKEVEVPVIDGIDSANTIWVNLTEEETLSMSNAIVEAYTCEGAILYTTKYIEPGSQTAATPTYVPSATVVNLITQSPNVVAEARTAMYNRYNSNSNIRNDISSNLSSAGDSATDNVNSGVATEVSTAKEQRQSYLDALAEK